MSSPTTCAGEGARHLHDPAPRPTAHIQDRGEIAAQRRGMVAMQDATDEIELEIQTLSFQHIFGQQIGYAGKMPPPAIFWKRCVSRYAGALPG